MGFEPTHNYALNVASLPLEYRPMKPVVLYRVEVIPTEGKRLRYAQRGGQTFSYKGAAKQRQADLMQRSGTATKLWMCMPVWTEVIE